MIVLIESVYPNAIYEPASATTSTNDQFLKIKPLEEGTKTPWIPVNPLFPNHGRFPRFMHACPITVTVNEGEMLYLPGETIFCSSLVFLHYVINPLLLFYYYL